MRNKETFQIDYFFIIKGDKGYWVCDEESPYEALYGKGNIRTDGTDPMKAVRFSHCEWAEEYIEKNWKEVGNRRPTIKGVETYINVGVPVGAERFA